MEPFRGTRRRRHEPRHRDRRVGPGPAGDRRDRDARGSTSVVGVLDRSFRAATTSPACPCSAPTTTSRVRGARPAPTSFVVAIGDNATRGRILDREAAAAPAPARRPRSCTRRRCVGPGCLARAGLHPPRRRGRRQRLPDRPGGAARHPLVGRPRRAGRRPRQPRPRRHHRRHRPHRADTAVGLGASVIHGVTIGDDTVVGAGARGAARTCPTGSWPTACPPGWPRTVNRASPTSERAPDRRLRGGCGALISLDATRRQCRRRSAPPSPEDPCPIARRNLRRASRQQYALPHEYGPARPAVGNESYDLFATTRRR